MVDVLFNLDPTGRVTITPKLQGDRTNKQVIPLDDGTTVRPVPLEDSDGNPYFEADSDGMLTVDLHPGSAASRVGSILYRVQVQASDEVTILVPDSGGNFSTMSPYEGQDPVSSKGDTGPVGPRGPAGPQGHTGAQGAKGDKGDTGATGATGAAGPPGHDGTDGAQGNPGHDAYDLIYVYLIAADNLTPSRPSGGSIDTATLTVTAPTPWSTGPGIPGADQALYFSTAAIPPGTTGTYNFLDTWSSVGEAGAQGPPGPTGPTGATGQQGQTGQRGPAGADGTDGAPGMDGTDGAPGTDGTDGWSPIFDLHQDGDRWVLQLHNWTGGTGAHPGFVGQYVGVAGFVTDVAQAIDLVGPQGPPGSGGGDFDFASLPGRNDPHTNHDIMLAESLTPYRTGLTHLIGLIGSSAGLGARLNPNPSTERAGDLPIVNADGDGYSHTSGDRLPPDPSEGSAGDALFRNDDGSGYHLGRIKHPDSNIVEVGFLPEATADAPKLVYLTHGYQAGNKEDATLTVGYQGAAAGYRFPIAGDPGYGHVNKDSPLSRVYGRIVTFADDGATPSIYVLDAIASFNENWLESLDRIQLGNTVFRLGDVEGPQGHEWQRRIIDFNEGFSASTEPTLDINFRIEDGASWYFTDNASQDPIDQGFWELPTHHRR